MIAQEGRQGTDGVEENRGEERLFKVKGFFTASAI
jgi:hypothetical protein